MPIPLLFGPQSLAFLVVLLSSVSCANSSRLVFIAFEYIDFDFFDTLINTFIHHAIINIAIVNINILFSHLYSSSCRDKQSFFCCCRHQLTFSHDLRQYPRCHRLRRSRDANCYEYRCCDSRCRLTERHRAKRCFWWNRGRCSHRFCCWCRSSSCRSILPVAQETDRGIRSRISKVRIQLRFCPKKDGTQHQCSQQDWPTLLDGRWCRYGKVSRRLSNRP